MNACEREQAPSTRWLPAHLTSGGRALLAELPPAELVELYEGSGVDLRRLHRSLHRVRADGYAINQGATEDGVTAVGIAVHGLDHAGVCAISVSMPSTRFKRAILPTLVEALAATRADLEEAIGRF